MGNSEDGRRSNESKTNFIVASTFSTIGSLETFLSGRSHVDVSATYQSSQPYVVPISQTR